MLLLLDNRSAGATWQPSHASQATCGLDGEQLGAPFLDNLSLSVDTRNRCITYKCYNAENIFFCSWVFWENSEKWWLPWSLTTAHDTQNMWYVLHEVRHWVPRSTCEQLTKWWQYPCQGVVRCHHQISDHRLQLLQLNTVVQFIFIYVCLCVCVRCSHTW